MEKDEDEASIFVDDVAADQEDCGDNTQFPLSVISDVAYFPEVPAFRVNVDYHLSHIFFTQKMRCLR